MKPIFTVFCWAETGAVAVSKSAVAASRALFIAQFLPEKQFVGRRS
jgi:hypothetical protein